MLEFSWDDADARDLEGVERSCHTVNRLMRLAAIAAKLQQEGWLVWMTVTGLAFNPMFSPVQETEEAQELFLEAVNERLAELDIWEEPRDVYGKTWDELPDAWVFWMWDHCSRETEG